MLDTRDRKLLLETLRPPVGYSIDRAVGTSYTLDLTALLTAPLAFTFFNYHDEDGEPTSDPVALLEALRRHAERITLFCQAGAIAVPKPNQLFVYLERSVVEVQAPKKGGLFHPKVWLLRFVAEDQPVRYRLLCLSRNLTFARAWDTCLVVDGELTDRKLGFSVNRPLGEFIGALTDLAVRPPSAETRADIERIASEVRRVRFEVPAPFKELAFHPMGLDRRASWPFPEGAQLMVIAPYLTEWALRKCTEEDELEVLISRPEALASMPRELLPEEGTYVLSPGAEMDSQEAHESDESESDNGDLGKMGPDEPDLEGAPVELAGLHAKLYVAQRSHNSHVFTGSANATTAAFQRNVEFLVELVGGWKHSGIRGILGDPEDRNQSSLHSLLQRYRPPEDVEEVDDVQEKLERDIDRLTREIAGRRLTARVEPRKGEESYDLRLSGHPPEIPDGAEVWLWPVSLSAEQRKELRVEGTTLARFEGLSFEALTAFWAFEIRMEREKHHAVRRFAVAARLVGAPKDRRERLLSSLLRNSQQVLRLLLLMLSDEGLDVTKLVAAVEDDPGGEKRWLGGWDEPTLLEAMLHSLGDDPRRLDHAARLIEDLRRTPEGAALLPADLDAIWEPIWKTREELR